MAVPSDYKGDFFQCCIERPNDASGAESIGRRFYHSAPAIDFAKSTAKNIPESRRELLGEHVSVSVYKDWGDTVENLQEIWRT